MNDYVEMGFNASVTIPSVFVTYDSGQRLHAYIKDGKPSIRALMRPTLDFDSAPLPIWLLGVTTGILAAAGGAALPTLL